MSPLLKNYLFRKILPHVIIWPLSFGFSINTASFILINSELDQGLTKSEIENKLQQDQFPSVEYIGKQGRKLAYWLNE